MPVLQRPPGRLRAHLPARERVPPLSSLTQAQRLEVLYNGTVDVRGRLVDASNATLLVTVTHDGAQYPAVYKPVAGERPLWDFPHRTLARREVAAYELSAAAGWDVVPPTVLREGPFGPGSLQWWIDSGLTDEDGDPLVPEPGAGVVDVVAPQQVPSGWLTVLRAEGYDGEPVVLTHADDEALRRMALFDAVANNADRKGGHVLRDLDGQVLGVDHGLTFNVEDKLRTVLWGWAGDALGEHEVEALTRVGDDLEGSGPLRRTLADLLSGPELRQTRRRVEQLLRAGRWPQPPSGRPPIPWPAF